MKQLIVFLSLMLCTAATQAQLTQLAQGPQIAGGKGSAQVLQFSNGYTAFVYNLPQTKEYQFEIYDAAHKRIAEKRLRPDAIPEKDHYLQKCYRSGSDLIAILGVEAKEEVPQLYRVVYDSKTGDLKSTDKIAEREKEPKNSRAAQMWGNMPQPLFYFNISPDEHFYAVTIMNTFVEDRNKRIEMALFNSKHEEVAHGFFTSPENGKFKYMSYEDMAVANTGKVFVLATAENTRSSGGKESDLVLAELEQGKNTAIIHGLDGWEKEKVWKGTLKFNPVTNKLLYFYTRTIKKRLQPHILTIDATTGKVESDNIILLEDFEPAYQERFGRKAEIGASPQQLVIRKDGTFSAVFESIYERDSKWNDGRIAERQTELGKLIVVNFDVKGKLVNHYILPQRQYLYDDMRRSFYQATDSRFLSETKDRGKEFNTSLFINSVTHPGILFNDDPENEELALKGKKLNAVKDTDNCDAFFFPLNGTDIFPPRKYVFKKGAGKGDHSPAFMGIADYDDEHNILAILKHEGSGKSRFLRLVWLQL